MTNRAGTPFAWTEVYVDGWGWGWVPVEATGGDDPRFDALAPPSDPDEGPDGATPEPSGEPADTPEPTPEPEGPEQTPEPSAEPDEPDASDEPDEPDEPDASDEPDEPDEPDDSDEPTPEPEEEPTPPPPGEEGSDPEDGPEDGPENGPPDEPRTSLFLLLLLLPLLPGLGYLYIRLRKRVCRNRMVRMLQGDGRAAVLYGYGELLRLVGHGAAPREEARILADEAAFSDHKLGEKEKKAMTGFVKAARKELERKLPWYKLWYLRYLLWLW